MSNKKKSKNSNKKTGASQQQQSSRKKLSMVPELVLQRGWIVLMALSVLLVGYYTLFPSRGYFHSDTTDTIMWAMASSESGTLFNPDFNYAALLPFNTSLIMWGLIPFFGATMTTHVLGMLCFALLYTAALVFMLRQMGWSWNWVTLGVFTELMICSGSDKLREIFWGHTIYYSLGVLFVFVGLGLLFRQLRLYEEQGKAVDEKAKKKSGKQIIIGMVLIGVWFLLTCTDQIIAIVIFALPVMAALFCERFLDEENDILCDKNRKSLLIFCIMGIGMVLGYLLTKLLAKGIVANYETTFSSYSAMDGWTDHLLSFPFAWITLLGSEAADGELLMTVKSVENILTVITGIVLLVIPLTALVCYKKLEDVTLKLLTLTFWFMTLLIMLGYVMGKLSVANWRLSPIVALAAVLTVAFLRWSVAQPGFKRIIPLMMVPVIMVSTITAINIAKMPADNTQDNELYTVAAELEARDLHYGYATFWTANALTIISDSKVKCRCFGGVDENGPWKDTYQQCESWYEDQPGVQEYFMIVSEGDIDRLREIESPLLEHVVDTFTINARHVLVLDQNVF